MDRIEWLNARKTGIGGSDVGGILGIGYNSPQGVYASKLDPVRDKPPAGFLRRGLDLEDIVAGFYHEVMNEELVLPETKIIRHPDRPWQLASLDRRRPDTNPVEMKTTVGFKDEEWGLAGSDEVPADYKAQCVHQMGVAGAEFCDLIALDIMAWEPRVYRILFDREQWEMLTEIEAKFWEFVQNRSGVPEDWDDFVSPLVKRVTIPGKAVALPDEVLGLIQQRQTFDAILKEAEAEKDRLTALIDAQLGDAEIGTVPGFSVKRIRVKAAHVPAYDKKSYEYIKVTKQKAIRGKK